MNNTERIFYEQHEFQVSSINWHLWPRCNYQCSFCFGQFKNMSTKNLSLDLQMQILDKITQLNAKKITFTGGEPLLCPHLKHLLIAAKQYGFVNMIVSNGSLITREFLENNYRYIDWIGLSIDSIDDRIERKLGRGNGKHIEHIKTIAPMIKDYDIKLKINVVVHQLNYKEDITTLIEELNPDRLKFLQILPIINENDVAVQDLLISKKQFQEFVDRHRHLNPVSEDNNAMIGSYVMLDPLGRFFQNFGNRITYSKSILEIDTPIDALRQVGWDKDLFIRRGGIYEW